MHPWILFRSGTRTVPLGVSSLAQALELRLPHLAATQTSAGGLRKLDLLSALQPAARAHALRMPTTDTFAGGEIDLLGREIETAVSVQTGRAYTNNGGVLAVMAAASMPNVHWLIVLAPERYKGSATGPRLEEQLAQLSRSRGVDLDLTGVLVLSF